LKGSWALIRMGGRAGEGGKNWLLIKHDDKYAKLTEDFNLVERKPKSVASKRTMEQIAAAADRVWSSNRSDKRSGSNGAVAAKASAKKATTTAKKKPVVRKSVVKKAAPSARRTVKKK
jgi:bifunctional non-homologous end joining protein LigD